MKNDFIRGERVALRPLEPADAWVLAACNNDPDVRISFFTHTPTTIHAQTERLKGFYQPGSDYIPLGVWVGEQNALIGVTALHRVDLVSGAAVFSICIADSAWWGKGYAKEATGLMIRYAFDVLNLHRIQLHTWVGNEAGFNIYKSLGFQEEGILREAMKHDGRWCDFHVMGLLESEWRKRKPAKVLSRKGPAKQRRANRS
ncbi:GNAT family N-acetyltransferase [Candidatus Sumerlaeota bacterium]|nr:GNAT family N-acetyltransferase [Candidatus Sumerlaeota bacterium]